MSIKYKSVPMNFNPYKFANSVIRAMDDAGVTYQEFDEIVGKSVTSAIRMTGRNSRSQPYYPTMRTFILICNALDLDPRSFFYLYDKDNIQF